jgi:TonB family protein
MTLPLFGANLGSYCLQVTLLLAAGFLLPSILRLRAPAPRLFLAQALLVGILILPIVQPWKAAATASPSVSFTMSPASVGGVFPAGGAAITPWHLLFGLIGAGVTLRFLWLASGLAALGSLRRRSTPLEPLPVEVRDLQRRLGVGATFRVSPRVQGPVAFGWWRPVVLVPPGFRDLSAESQEGVACHELLHVRRRDWLFILFEEAARALLWFHPAVWVLLGRIGLAREQAVDREVIRITGRKRAYLEALLRLAASPPEPAPGAALPFLRRSHLAQRVASLTQEVSMKKSRMMLAIGGAVTLLVLTAMAGFILFPILHPQEVSAAQPPAPAAKTPAQKVPEAGSPENPTMPKVLQKVNPEFPEEAKKAGKTGMVVAEILITETGAVEEVKILKSADKVFEQPVIDAVKQWKYEPPMKNGKAVRGRYTVTVSFKLD